VHAHYAVVFARLINNGVDEGLHGFLVNIRDEKDLSVKEGCQVWDMGYKIGLNGVDNAALWFNNVRVPRTNLLNATSNMDENGVFTSKVTFHSNSKEF
jgi:acyl-CoA oxidase